MTSIGVTSIGLTSIISARTHGSAPTQISAGRDRAT
jgi:hypothetical protein